MVGAGSSGFQRTDRADHDAIFRTLVGIWSCCREDHLECWLLGPLRIYDRRQPIQCRGTFFYQILPAKFDFNQSVVAIPHMNHGIALQAVGIQIMRNLGAKRVRIAP